MGLIVLRCVFLMVASGMGVFFVTSGFIPSMQPWMGWAAFGAIFGGALLVIVTDLLVRRKSVAAISAVYFGLIVGIFLAHAISLALIPIITSPRGRDATLIVLAVLLCYVCISLLLQTKDDFRFIIPYVEFTKERKGRRPYVLDTSVIIDGRIADVVETRHLRQPTGHAAAS